MSTIKEMKKKKSARIPKMEGTLFIRRTGKDSLEKEEFEDSFEG